MASLLPRLKAVLVFKCRALNLSEAWGRTPHQVRIKYPGDNETPLILCFALLLTCTMVQIQTSSNENNSPDISGVLPAFTTPASCEEIHQKIMLL